MTENINQNPEQIARDKIDEMLREAGWLVQSKKKVDLSAGKGVAVREYQTDVGPADYVLFVNRKPVGIISKSMGLVADSLDMLADSFVYGISLFAVGGTLMRKKQIAKLAGYFQILPALIGFVEVLRRFLGDEKLPDFSTMIIISIFALIGNGICLYILQKSKSKEEVHMKASMIFTSNDVIINLGVIIAGVLVNALNSSKPDLVIGTIVFVLVIQGAFRILKLSK